MLIVNRNVIQLLYAKIMINIRLNYFKRIFLSYQSWQPHLFFSYLVYYSLVRITFECSQVHRTHKLSWRPSYVLLYINWLMFIIQTRKDNTHVWRSIVISTKTQKVILFIVCIIKYETYSIFVSFLSDKFCILFVLLIFFFISIPNTMHLSENNLIFYLRTKLFGAS
jgi:hypothetical protein